MVINIVFTKTKYKSYFEKNEHLLCRYELFVVAILTKIQTTLPGALFVCRIFIFHALYSFFIWLARIHLNTQGNNTLYLFHHHILHACPSLYSTPCSPFFCFYLPNSNPSAFLFLFTFCFFHILF